MTIVFALLGAVALLHVSNIWRSVRIPSGSVRPTRVPAILYSVLILVCGAALLFALTRWADHEVRSDAREIAFYFIFSLACIVTARELFAIFGISWRDHVIERRNFAAGAVYAGFTMGATSSVAGANTGNGPGWWVVLFCAALSTGTLLVWWISLSWIARVHEAITIERDFGCGIRVGGFLLSTGLLLGGSVAGDWKSFAKTLADFALYAWPSAALLIAFSVFERVLARRALSKEGIGTTASAVIAAGMIAAAAVYLFRVGIRS